MTHVVYILASRQHGAIYVGATIDLRKRVTQQRAGAVVAYMRKYQIYTLVYFETHHSIEEALARERRIKRWRRAYKIDLIESVNPCWVDMSENIPL